MEHIDVAVIGGGQSGLATAHALLRHGLRSVVLEASDQTAGLWPQYYYSLTLFSPARYSSVTLATRGPVKCAAQRVLGRDLHWWLTRTGLDTAPLGRLLPRPPAQPVLDDGRYRAALAAGQPDRRQVFTGADGAKLVWPGGEREEVDAIVLATGYRSDLPYLASLDGALDAEGNPRHREGIATAVAGLAFVGLEWQRSLSSNSLRGVGRDADRVARRLTAHLSRR
ncbi:FAD-dependent oxidoreductase [Streptomyces canus]|uniref:FAD-dependent oxidoreductase n=1 Tax=Streptomyces TaxID=1883 RepID=UPI0036EC44A6